MITSRFPYPEEIHSGKQIVDYFLQHEITQHPFFSSEEFTNPGYIKLILENGRELDITGFLARTISMASDLRIRCALVPQLYDELGKGDPDKLHIIHIQRLLGALDRYTAGLSADEKAILEEAYKDLGAVYTKLFFSSEFYTCLGVAIANELVVQPIFEYIKSTVNAHRESFHPEEITWVTAHDELEEDHVSDTRLLAGLVPKDEKILKAVFDSGYELLTGIERFFDELQKIRLK